MAAHKKLGILGKMLARLERDKNFERLAIKVASWNEAEAENSEHKGMLTELAALFQGIESKRKETLQIVYDLKQANFNPPKKALSPQLKLEHGRHVWLKPKALEQYTAVLSGDALQNLFVDSVDGSKVVVSVGDPDVEIVTIKHLIPKTALRVTQAA